MSDLFAESFSYYGGSATRATEGFWTSFQGDIQVPSFETNPEKFWAKNSGTSGGDGTLLLRPLSAPTNEIIFSQRVNYGGSLNTASGYLIGFTDAGGARIVSIKALATGQLAVLGLADAQLGVSAGQVLFPTTSHHIEVRATRHASAGAVEVRVDGVAVVTLVGLALGANPFAIYSIRNKTFSITDIYVTDIWVRNVSGAGRNEGFESGAEIATLFLNADTAVAGWGFRARKNLGNGILDLSSSTSKKVTAADAADLELGSGDYTIEGFFRFDALPTGSNKAVIASKWQEANNRRSWELYKAGPTLESGGLIFRISTDGQAGTIVNIHDWPFAPDLNVWYYFAIARESGVNRLFLGEANKTAVQLGSDKADANTYFDGAALFVIGGEDAANQSLSGYMDEFRLTTGLARYTADFAAPTAKFGRNGVDDPNYASVKLLAGFDSGLNDESSVGRTLSGASGAASFATDDGDFAYQSTDDATPRDDTFIEASLVAASGILTMTALPLDTETVTLGATTYRFVTALASANDVLIGVDITTSRNNLIAAITAGAGSGTLYHAGTVQNASASASALPDDLMLATALLPGAAGNSIASTETLSNGSWAAATLLGGLDIPGPSEYVIERLPPEVTRVFSAHIIAREFKSSAGPASTQYSFVDGVGGFTNGADQPLTDNPVYRIKGVFVDDPTTAGPFTPVTLSGARVRVNRTV